MATYSVNVSGNLGSADSLRAVTEKLQASLEALTAKAEAFKAANAGVAIENYDAAQRLWNQGMQEMHTAMTVKGGNLQRITDNYVDADSRGAALFAR